MQFPTIQPRFGAVIPVAQVYVDGQPTGNADCINEGVLQLQCVLNDNLYSLPPEVAQPLRDKFQRQVDDYIPTYPVTHVEQDGRDHREYNPAVTSIEDAQKNEFLLTGVDLIAFHEALQECGHIRRRTGTPWFRDNVAASALMKRCIEELTAKADPRQALSIFLQTSQHHTPERPNWRLKDIEFTVPS